MTDQVPFPVAWLPLLVALISASAAIAVALINVAHQWLPIFRERKVWLGLLPEQRASRRSPLWGLFWLSILVITLTSSWLLALAKMSSNSPLPSKRLETVPAFVFVVPGLVPNLRHTRESRKAPTATQGVSDGSGVESADEDEGTENVDATVEDEGPGGLAAAATPMAPPVGAPLRK